MEDDCRARTYPIKPMSFWAAARSQFPWRCLLLDMHGKTNAHSSPKNTTKKTTDVLLVRIRLSVAGVSCTTSNVCHLWAGVETLTFNKGWVHASGGGPRVMWASSWVHLTCPSMEHGSSHVLFFLRNDVMGRSSPSPVRVIADNRRLLSARYGNTGVHQTHHRDSGYKGALNFESNEGTAHIYCGN